MGWVQKSRNKGGIIFVDLRDRSGIVQLIFENGSIDEKGFEKATKLRSEFVIAVTGVCLLYTSTVTNEYYPMLAKVLFEVAVKLEKETGADIEFINLSGGVGIPYKPDQEPNDIRVIGEGVRKVYEEVLVPAGMGDVALYTEMGRFMTGPYGCLVTKAIHEKHTYKEYIGCDACAVNLMRPATVSYTHLKHTEGRFITWLRFSEP